MKKEITGVLQNWRWDNVHNVYWGNVYNDSKGRFRDGTYIHTSTVNEKDRDKKRGGCNVHTLNSVYRLGRKFTSNMPKLLGY